MKILKIAQDGPVEEHQYDKMGKLRLAKAKVTSPEGASAAAFGRYMQENYRWRIGTIGAKLSPGVKLRDPILFNIFTQNEVIIDGETYKMNSLEERAQVASDYLGEAPATSPEWDSAAAFGRYMQKNYGWKSSTIRRSLRSGVNHDPDLFNIFTQNEVTIDGETYKMNSLEERAQIASDYLGEAPVTSPEGHSPFFFAKHMKKNYGFSSSTISAKLTKTKMHDPDLFKIFTQNEVTIDGKDYEMNSLEERAQVASDYLETNIRKFITSPEEDTPVSFGKYMQENYGWSKTTIRQRLTKTNIHDPILVKIFTQKEVTIDDETYKINSLEERAQIASDYLGSPRKNKMSPEGDSAASFNRYMQENYGWEGTTISKKITSGRRHDPILFKIFTQKEVAIDGKNYEINSLEERAQIASDYLGPPKTSNDFRPSVHTEGGESRSWHEVVIRDMFFFTGTNFIYEPPNWTNLSFVEKYKRKCFGEAKTYNEKYLAKKQEKDPDYVMPHKPYETTYPQPDFLINNTTLFEVFGGSPEMEKYEISMGFKKEKFTKFFSNHFAYIDKKPLDSAALNDRTLVAYATALDDKIEGAKSSIGNQFQSELLKRADLLEENNIHLNVNYRTQISSFSEDDRTRTRFNVENYGEYPTDKDVNAPIPFEQLPKATVTEQTETATDQAVASNDSWYKLAQSSGYNRTEPASMNEISSALKQEGFWSSHRWSENDRIAMYFKTPENLQMALSKLQQPIMEFPQQEKQIAAFNLSRMKK